jgi:hypothetical protein
MFISLPEEADLPHQKSTLGGAATPKMLKQISRLRSKLRLTPNII